MTEKEAIYKVKKDRGWHATFAENCFAAESLLTAYIEHNEDKEFSDWVFSLLSLDTHSESNASKYGGPVAFFTLLSFCLLYKERRIKLLHQVAARL